MHLTKPAGLRKRKLFLRVQATGRRFRSGSIVLQVAPSPEVGPGRVGFTVSRRVGNAVVRNRMRRRLKEIVRTSQDALLSDYDYVVIALPSIVNTPFEALRQEVQCLLNRTRKWDSQQPRWSP